MAKTQKTPIAPISGAQQRGSHADAENAPDRQQSRKSAISGEPLPDGEHESVYEKAHAAVEVILDGKTFTLPELITAYWDLLFERNAFAEEHNRSMAAMVRIYGQPPYEDCGLSEYLEIVADGELDDIRKEFEDGLR